VQKDGQGIRQAALVLRALPRRTSFKALPKVVRVTGFPLTKGYVDAVSTRFRNLSILPPATLLIMDLKAGRAVVDDVGLCAGYQKDY
jgi:hypothetical protein